jgi:outer membrane protein OmpA-like peptidoglycan-associated protein
MYIDVSLNPQKQLLSLDDKIDAFGMFNRLNFSSKARSYTYRFQDNFDSREEAMFEGLKKNFPESFENLSNYLRDIYVFEPDASKVHFDSNSAILKSQYTQEVDNLIFLMKLFPNSTYEIGAHTDNVGTEKANFELSQNRANSIVNYMIDNGIDANRLFPVGFGESNPRADNSTEAGRALNRRVEFKVIDTGY